MKNIFKNAYFGKPYKTKSGNKALYIGVDDYSPIHLLFVDDWFSIYDYNSEGFALDNDSNPMSECELNIVSEWQDEISEEEYKNKLDELYESCVYWEAYEDEPELFAESLKELLDFAPKDKKTIDYCAYLIKSRKTILNELDNIVISFAKDKSKEITINYGNV